MSLPKDYDEVRKIVLKNLQIRYYQLEKDSLNEVYPADHMKRLHRDIQVNPEIIVILEEHFRRKFHAEKNQTT